MAVELFIHKMTEHMDRARILQWLAVEGERVQPGQVIMEVETEKAVVELEAPAGGVLKGIRPGAVNGAEVAVGETLAFIAEVGEIVPTLPPLGELGAVVEPGPAGTLVGEVPATAETVPINGLVRATPVARRVAKELGVELRLVSGSGPGGVVRHQDVHVFAQRTRHPSPASQPVPLSKLAETADMCIERTDTSGSDYLDLTTAQRLTGQRMLESLQTAPQFALSIDVDMNEALEVCKAQTEGQDKPPSITAFLVRACALTLNRHPRLNASFSEGRIQIHPQINIGVAVGTSNGLVVPVIKHSAALSLLDISTRIQEFQTKAREMRFSLDDLSGGTFTISNLGMYGVDRFNAILNPPQSAILAVGRIAKIPSGLPDGSIALCPMCSLTLAVDHRVLDGIQAAQFLADIKKLIEQPYLMI